MTLVILICWQRVWGAELIWKDLYLWSNQWMGAAGKSIIAAGNWRQLPRIMIGKGWAAKRWHFSFCGRPCFWVWEHNWDVIRWLSSRAQCWTFLESVGVRSGRWGPKLWLEAGFCSNLCPGRAGYASDRCETLKISNRSDRWELKLWLTPGLKTSTASKVSHPNCSLTERSISSWKGWMKIPGVSHINSEGIYMKMQRACQWVPVGSPA